jgi:ubiquinone biosynthesis protein UbiJ
VYASTGLFIMTSTVFIAQAQAAIRDGLLTGLERALNHLLRAEPWTREKLLPHAGKQVCFRAEPVRLVLQVSDAGTIQARSGMSETAPDVTLTLAWSAFPSAALTAMGQETTQALLKHVRIEGDAEFAAVIADLMQKLRWDIEEDLSHYVGDIAAYRAVSTARSAAQQLQDTGRRLVAQLTDYWLEENPTLVARQDMEAWVAELRSLRDAVERFEKRLQQSPISRRGR